MGGCVINKITLAYLAGLVDGEGYIGIKKSKAYKCQGRVNPGYHERVQVRQVKSEAIELMANTFGGCFYKEKPGSKKSRPLYCYQASDKKAVTILKALIPYLRIKGTVAIKVLELRELKKESSKHRTKIVGHRNFPNKYGTPRKVPNLAYSDEYIAMCESLWLDCKRLNKVGI